MRHIAHRSCAGARLVLAGILAIPAGVSAQDPAPDPIVLAIEPLLQSDSALVRGEAALALAATGDPKYHPQILDIATDKDPVARHRGMLALGLLGQPGSDILLDRVSRKSSRDSVERLLAALALGLLPDEPRVPAIDDFFRRAGSASRKRIRDELVCLLLGFRRTPHPQRLTVLRTFVADATYRNRSELALVIDILARVPSVDNRTTFLAQLGSKNKEISIATLAALADRRVTFEPKHWKQIQRIAEHAAHQSVRAAALDLLAFHRKPDALGIAGRFLHGEDPECVGAAIRTILALGGSTLRQNIEDRILATTDSPLRSAMLRAKKGPHGDAFVKACIDIARSGEHSFELRASATKIVAEAGWSDLLPTATRLFLAARDPESAADLAVALERLGVTVDDKVLQTKTVEDVALFPMRLRALLAAGSQQALATTLQYLTKPPSDAVQLDALRAYRSVRVNLFDKASWRLVPPALHDLLGDR
jgi:HEAT repeat protein